MIIADYEDEIRQIRELYNVAEADLKSVGREQNVLIVAGVNQLRYAGQHLVRALAADDQAQVEAELGASTRHAQRAIYDINDAAIQFYLTEIKHFRSRYPVNLNLIVTNYEEVIGAVTQASSNIEEASQSNRSNRELLYESVRVDVVALRNAYRTLEASVPDVTSAVQAQNRTILKTWAYIAVVVVSIAISVAQFLSS